ncbi:MAG: alkaline phosphatase family protein [Verrucomicrobia bacterium]|nr:alkaline phosphatase family protein [Verrucomicrobiota bacterium]
MNRLTVLLCLAALFAAGVTPRAAAQTSPARLVVLISVDGLAHYYFDDPKAEMPTIRELAATGARAQMMRASMPSVTWPNHTTLVTGTHPAKHGVIGNNYFSRAKNESVPLIPDPFFNKEEIVKSPTIYDVAKAAGLRTAAIIWPASRGAKTLDWTVPDCFSNSLWQAYGTPKLLAEFKAAGIPYEKQEEWCKTGKGEERDKMYVQMFNHVVRNHRPHVGLLHLVEVDHVEHAKGPQSPEAYAAVKFADDRVREVWDNLKKTFPGKATLIVASDHGFFRYQQSIQPNVLLKKEGLLQLEGTKIAHAKVRALGQGGGCFLYVLDHANREKHIARLTKLFQKVEGIDVVIPPSDFKKYGLADPKRDANMADLMLSAKEGYSFSDTAAGEIIVTPKTDAVKGTHGYNQFQPRMHASFVAWGAGIKPGSTLGTISNTDVAPTMAALLGLEMQDVDGRVLKEILTK